MNRQQRKKDIKHWDSLLKKHLTKKPSYPITDVVDQSKLNRVNTWATDFLFIKKKLETLNNYE